MHATPPRHALRPRRASRPRRARPGLELLESRLAPALTRLPPVLVNPTDPAQGQPPGIETPYVPPAVAVAEDAAGDFVVAWTSLSGGGADIHAQRFDPFGKPRGGEITVAAGVVPESQFPRPAVGMDAAGDFVIAFDTVDGIFASRYDAAGNPLDTTPFQVDTTNSFGDYSPAVALDDHGRFVIAYAGFDQTGSAVFARRGFTSGSTPLDPSGPLTVAETPFSAFVSYASPSVAADAAGDFVVAYEADDFLNSTSSVFAQRFDAAGNALGSPIGLLPTGSPPGTESAPSVAVDRASGAFAVTWVESNPAPVLMAETFVVGGVPVAGPFAVSRAAAPPSAQPYDSPAVAADAAGDFVAVWAVHAAPSGVGGGAGVIPSGRGPATQPTGDVFAQTFTADGTLTGAPILITPQPDAPGPTAVAMDAAGNFVVTYSAAQQTVTTSDGPGAADNSAYDVLAVIFRALPPAPSPAPPTPPAPTPPSPSPPAPPATLFLDPAVSLAYTSAPGQNPAQKASPSAAPPVVPLLPRDAFAAAVTQLTPVAVDRFNPAAQLTQQVGGTEAVGAISGRLFADLNGDGTPEPGKPPLAGRLVFLDLNNNGMLDEGEPTAVTDENGEYSFSGLRLRTYQVRQVLSGGDTQTLPAENGAYEVRLDAVRHDVVGRDFGSLSSGRRTTAPAGRPAPGAAPAPPPASSEPSDGLDEE